MTKDNIPLSIQEILNKLDEIEKAKTACAQRATQEAKELEANRKTYPKTKNATILEIPSLKMGSSSSSSSQMRNVDEDNPDE